MTKLVFAGGAPSWRSPRAATLRAGATIGERVSFAQETEGWLVSDEMSFIISKIRERSEDFHFAHMMVYVQHTDEFVTDGASMHTPNRGITLIPLLLGSHWVGLEIDKT